MLTLSPLIATSEYKTFISVSTFIIEPSSCGMATQMLILKSLVSLVSVTFGPRGVDDPRVNQLTSFVSGFRKKLASTFGRYTRQRLNLETSQLCSRNTRSSSASRRYRT